MSDEQLAQGVYHRGDVCGWYCDNSTLAEAVSREAAQRSADQTGTAQNVFILDGERGEEFVLYTIVKPGERSTALREGRA